MAKKDAIQWVTPWFTARYPKISKPDTQGKYADNKFKTDGFLEDAEYEAVEEKLKEAAAKLWPDVPLEDVNLPLKEFFKNKEDKAKGEAEGRGLVLKSKYRPAVFDAKKKKLPDNVEVGGGSVIRVDALIFPYSKTEKVKTKDAKGKVTVEEVTAYGLGLRLRDIQVKELHANSGAGTGEGFDEEEGFTYDGEGDDNEGGKGFDEL